MHQGQSDRFIQLLSFAVDSGLNRKTCGLELRTRKKNLPVASQAQLYSGKLAAGPSIIHLNPIPSTAKEEGSVVLWQVRNMRKVMLHEDPSIRLSCWG